MLHEGENIGHDLYGMVFIGKTVDHRHAAVLGKGFQTILPEGADHDQVTHAAYDARSVFNGFRAAEL